MNPVVHFQMPADDKARMSKFYTEAFGWKTNQMGEDMNNYVVVQTAPTNDKGMLLEPGRINGGFFQRTDDLMSQYPSIVIAVPDINESMKKIENAGGKIQSQPDHIPGVGLFATFFDTEGNHVCILQPIGM